jgi:broad specificity phosphatase PhoE
MTISVFFVRHAAHDELGIRLSGRTSTVRLNSTGVDQARSLARYFAHQPVNDIFTSPLDRSLLTAEEIARRCGRPVQIEEALNEIDFGDWSGRTFESLDCEPLWRQWNELRDVTRAPGGECMQDVQARILRWLERIDDGRTAIVAVSHADVIKATVAIALGLPADSYWRFDVDPASITTLTREGNVLRLTSLNGVAHA